MSHATLEKIVSLCKRRGFVFPAADIYGGINGVYDFGPLGTTLRHTLKQIWRSHMTSHAETVVEIDGSILAPEAVWKASGHIDGFSDPMIDCTSCKKRFRADEIDITKNCPHCGNAAWTDVREFNLMFKTQLGALESSAHAAYLRPETAQSIFVNFKNVMSSSRVKIPFGIAQIGKAFRNEITPKQFLFRMREFEQMEMQFFCHETEAAAFFDRWFSYRENFYDTIGLTRSKLRMHEHTADERAHYAQHAVDFEYEFPFGWKELEGVHNRGNFDLSQHSSHSGKDLSVFDQETNSSYIPHVVECSVGLDRLFLAVLCDAYTEDVIEGDERVVLKLSPKLAPVSAALLPLQKKLGEPIHRVYTALKEKGYSVVFDETGSIGKRYRRQDEIGTPVCFTYDFDSETDQCVTARNRDTLAQERISIDRIEEYINSLT